MFSYSVVEILHSAIGRIAVNGSDYDGRSDVLLTFNAVTRSIEVPVGLINDNTYETEEDFNGVLSLVSDSPGVTIAPDNALATIEDDDGMQNCLFRISPPYRKRCHCVIITCNFGPCHCRPDHWLHWSTLPCQGERGTHGVHCRCDWKHRAILRCGSVLLHSGWVCFR